MRRAKVFSLVLAAVALVAAVSTSARADYKIRKASDPIVDIVTPKGTIKCEIFAAEAPKTSANFLDLVNKGFYNGLTFHRVEDWVVQGGDPTGRGSGDYIDPKTHQARTINLETNPALKHDSPGVMAMARTQDPNSASCQFYFIKKPSDFLDGQYAVFGHVITGMDIVDGMQIGDKMTKVFVEKK